MCIAIKGRSDFGGTRRFIPYLRLVETRDRGADGVDVAYSTIVAFFLCWWLLGLLLKRMCGFTAA